MAESKSITAIVEKVSEVCPLPASAARVMQLCSDEQARIEPIAEVVATDPALAAQVLRIANSPYFGGRHQTSDLGRGIMMIGLSELRKMAGAMAMLAAFRGKLELSYGFHDLSVLAGCIAQGLAKQLRVDKSEAFVCGLLCEIGAMACCAVDAEGYRSIWERASSKVELRAELETEHYGGTSREIAGGLLERNGLPPNVCRAVRAGADPDADLLDRLTFFCRQAALFVVRSGKNPGVDLVTDLAALQQALALPREPTVLHEVCLSAAKKTLGALKRAS